jgi:hypothetical protein
MTKEEAIEYIKTNKIMIGHLRKYNAIIKDVVWLEDRRFFRVTCDLSKDGQQGLGSYQITENDLEVILLKEKLLND